MIYHVEKRKILPFKIQKSKKKQGLLCEKVSIASKTFRASVVFWKLCVQGRRQGNGHIFIFTNATTSVANLRTI